MREIVSKRRTHSKVFDLGNRRRKVRVSRAPLHYLRDGKLVDIDATLCPAGRLLEVTEAPYRLKIDPQRPAYLYTTENGRRVEAELIEVGGVPVRLSRSVQEARVVRWKGIASSTDLAFRPLRHGIEALVVLYGPEAPRVWMWRVRGDRDLMLPPSGRDASGQVLELQHHYDGDLLTITWTGRVTSGPRLRRKQGFTSDVVYPVLVDPTINEAIIDAADDGLSLLGRYATQILNATYLRAGVFFGYIYAAGVRFQGIDVPQGTEISAATMTIDILQVGTPAGIDVRLYGDAVDDAPVWSPASKIENITKTTAFKAVQPTATGLYPIALTNIVQEIVNRPGWSSGNDVRFAFLRQGGTQSFTFAALEHATRTEAQLEIEYGASGFSGIFHGETQINAIKHGSDDIVAVYYGSTKIFEAG